MSDGPSIPSKKVPVDALPFNLDILPKEFENKAKTELSEDPDKIQKNLKLLKCLLSEEKDLHWQNDDLFLLAFLRVAKFDAKKAYSRMKGFYNTLGKHGRIFYTFNLNYIKRIMEENSYGFLPYRDKDGSIVIFFRFTTWDPKVISNEEHLACITLGLMQSLLNPATQIAGAKLIVDCKGLALQHFIQITPSNLLFFFQMFQTTIPIRLQGLHVVNENILFSYLWSLSKVFLTKKFQERVHVHGSDVQKLHKYFDPSILPAELGGHQPPFDNTPWRETMEKSADYLQHMVSFGYEKYLKKYRNSTESASAK